MTQESRDFPATFDDTGGYQDVPSVTGPSQETFDSLDRRIQVWYRYPAVDIWHHLTHCSSKSGPLPWWKSKTLGTDVSLRITDYPPLRNKLSDWNFLLCLVDSDPISGCFCSMMMKASDFAVLQVKSPKWQVRQFYERMIHTDWTRRSKSTNDEDGYSVKKWFSQGYRILSNMIEYSNGWMGSAGGLLQWLLQGRYRCAQGCRMPRGWHIQRSEGSHWTVFLALLFWWKSMRAAELWGQQHVFLLFASICCTPVEVSWGYPYIIHFTWISIQLLGSCTITYRNP